MRRSIREEAGIALPLAMILIVVIGVMGAGLLVFVNTDLNSVVEVNRGQTAFEAADAGVAAAGSQLKHDSTESKYDNPDAGDPNLQWAETKGGMVIDDPATGGSTEVEICHEPQNSGTDDCGPYNDKYDGTFVVTSTGEYSGAKRKIEASLKSVPGVNLPETYHTNANATCSSNANFELRMGTADLIAQGDTVFDSNCSIDMNGGNIYTGGDATFNSNAELNNSNIMVDGTANFNSNVTMNGGAGLFVREDANFDSNTSLDGGRLYVGRDASFNSNSIVSNGSVYIGRNATFESNSGLNGASLFSGGNVILNSTNFSLGNAVDPVYGNWSNDYNPTARGSDKAGIGAVGTISGTGTSKASKGTRSYDSTTSPRFVGSGATAGSSMNFPFDPVDYAAPLDNMAATASSSTMSQSDIERLREIAQEQEAATGRNHYRDGLTNGQTYTINSTNDWPIASSDQYGYGTVVFYSFPSDVSGNKVILDVQAATCGNTDRKGVLVVENGDVETGSNSKGFNGWVIAWNGKFTAGSNTCTNAYINATDGIKLDSNAEIYDPPEETEQDLAIFDRIEVKDWRELYE